MRSKSPQGTSRSVSVYGLRSYHWKRGERTERESMASLYTGSSPGGPGQDLPLCKVRKTFKLPSWSIGHCDWKVIGSFPFVNIPNPLLAAGSFGGKKYRFAPAAPWSARAIQPNWVHESGHLDTETGSPIHYTCKFLCEHVMPQPILACCGPPRVRGRSGTFLLLTIEHPIVRRHVRV